MRAGVTAACQQLIDFLVADMEATEDTAYATDLLTAAKAKITAGAGQLVLLTSASLNGKSFTGEGTLSAVEVAYAARRALDIYDDTAGQSPITFPDLSETFR